MSDEVNQAIARLDAATAEMKAALDAINVLWNRASKGGEPLTLDEIQACRRAHRRASMAAG